MFDTRYDQSGIDTFTAVKLKLITAMFIPIKNVENLLRYIQAFILLNKTNIHEVKYTFESNLESSFSLFKFFRCQECTLGRRIYAEVRSNDTRVKDIENLLEECYFT